jgi:hypothetical protein
MVAVGVEQVVEEELEGLQAYGGMSDICRGKKAKIRSNKATHRGARAPGLD